MPSKRKQGRKSKRNGAAEKAKNKGRDCYNTLNLTNCLKTQHSALHAQTLEAIILHLE